MSYTQEEREAFYEQIKEISIMEYAKDSGYAVVRKGRYYSLKEHDSVRIDPEKNCFWRNAYLGEANAQGSIIDFVMHFEDKTFSEAAYHLGQYIPGSKEKNVPAKRKKALHPAKGLIELQKPKPDKTDEDVLYYLTKVRKIHPEIVAKLIKEKRIYQDIHKNCVFVTYHEGKAVFAAARGTRAAFYQDAEGNDYRFGWHLCHNADCLVVTEAVIDILSIMTILLQQGADITRYDYLALAGTGKLLALECYLKSHPGIRKIYAAVDRDEPGKKVLLEIYETYSQERKVVDARPKWKDWNEQLINKMEGK